MALQHFFEWARHQLDRERPWLILGKGPSFGRRTRFDLSNYSLLSLNHAVREQSVLLAHMIDLDVVDACGPAVLGRAGYVVLPWYPHVHNVPGKQSLQELVPNHALLRRLDDEGRLLWYDLSTAARRHGPGPVVRATYFSAEAAVSLLALAGVRRIRSLGVDGGAQYSAHFSDLERRTLLANGRVDFDLQFAGIARTILQTGVDFAPLDQPSPVLVYVCSGDPTSVPDRVLEFSIRKRTSMSVVVRWIGPAADPEAPAEPSANQGVGADGHDWRRAILVRSGTLVLDDLRKLWTLPHDREGVAVARAAHANHPPASAIAVATAREPRIVGALRAAMQALGAPAISDGLPELPAVVEALPASWSRADPTEEGDASIVLYATPGLEPWISRGHPLAHVWVSNLLEAIQAGFIARDEVEREVGRGRLRPSLLEQVETGNPESLLVSRSARRRDAGFTPVNGPVARPAGPVTHAQFLLRAYIRRARRQVRAYRHRLAPASA